MNTAVTTRAAIANEIRGHMLGRSISREWRTLDEIRRAVQAALHIWPDIGTVGELLAGLHESPDYEIVTRARAGTGETEYRLFVKRGLIDEPKKARRARNRADID